MGDAEKSCFVIAPIGDDDSETRKRSDIVLEYIIKPVAEACGYDPVTRADQIARPGRITAQVIEHLIDAPLVIADLTDHNPNVFYELAIRHVIRKPIVQLIQSGQDIPFDVRDVRTIPVDHTNLRSVDSCKKKLEAQIRSVESDPTDVDTPISSAIDLKSLRMSKSPVEKTLAQILSTLQDVSNAQRTLFMEQLNLRHMAEQDPLVPRGTPSRASRLPRLSAPIEDHITVEQLKAALDRMSPEDMARLRESLGGLNPSEAGVA